MACCESCGHGCNGGRVWDAWKYFKSDGVVSGGLYGTHETCQPYLIKPKEKNDSRHQVEKTPPCSDKCDPNFNRTYEQDKYYALNYDGITTKDVKQIQMQILKNGPVVAQMTVYDDLHFYDKGQYLSMLVLQIR